MSISVNSSRSALNALQTLARGTDPAQSRTGPSQKSASERGPQAPASPGADLVSLAQAKRSLDRAASITDVALSAGQTVSDILEQLRSGEGDSRGARLQAALRQIDQAVEKASFDGVNLLDGSLDEDLSIALDGGAAVTLPARDLRSHSRYVALTPDSGEADVEAAAVNVSSAMADLRIQSRQVEAHGRFVSRFGETLVGEQVEGDLSKEAARLQALQIQQQLAAQQDPIGNRAPQLVLQLFRG